MGKYSEMAIQLAEKEYLLMEMDMNAFKRIKQDLDQEEYFIRKVDVKDFDYSFDTAWSKLDEKAKKAYKEKKEREFELRMFINDQAKKENKSSE